MTQFLRKSSSRLKVYDKISELLSRCRLRLFISRDEEEINETMRGENKLDRNCWWHQVITGRWIRLYFYVFSLLRISDNYSKPLTSLLRTNCGISTTNERTNERQNDSSVGERRKKIFHFYASFNLRSFTFVVVVVVVVSCSPRSTTADTSAIPTLVSESVGWHQQDCLSTIDCSAGWEPFLSPPERRH